MMKLIPFVGAAALALTLAGCGTVVSLPSHKVTAQEAFIDAVHSTSKETIGADDAKLIKLAKADCSALAAGTSIDTIISIELQHGLSPETTGAILGAGISAFCPEYGDQLPTE